MAAVRIQITIFRVQVDHQPGQNKTLKAPPAGEFAAHNHVHGPTGASVSALADRRHPAAALVLLHTEPNGMINPPRARAP
jgi:hypothetical protein